MLHVVVVTINSNEAAAVDLLLDEIESQPGSAWNRSGAHSLVFGVGIPQFRLSHETAPAQGNVVAAGVLSRLFADLHHRPDFVVFYGCAGAADPGHVEGAFFVKSVNYLALGDVTGSSPHDERARLKSKWLVFTYPPEVQPLQTVIFDGLELAALEDTALLPAHIASTDKVIKLDLTGFAAPQPVHHGLPHDQFDKTVWCYGEALALLRDKDWPLPLLIEMESFGIGIVSEAADLLDRVLVLRIVTDCLSDHGASDVSQAALLLAGRAALLQVLHKLFFPGEAVL